MRSGKEPQGQQAARLAVPAGPDLGCHFAAQGMRVLKADHPLSLPSPWSKRRLATPLLRNSAAAHAGPAGGALTPPLARGKPSGLPDNRFPRRKRRGIDFVVNNIAPVPETHRWSFTVHQDIIVTALGFWDVTPATPLGENHPVGIWTSGGTLLGSATVLTDSPLLGGFRYAESPQFSLGAGQTYVIGALISGPVDNFYITSRETPVTVTTGPEISYFQARAGSFGGTPILMFPSFFAIGPEVGRFGPNFQYVIPEPGTLALLGTGALTLLGYGWRRRRRAA